MSHVLSDESSGNADNDFDLTLSGIPWSISHSELVEEQQADSSLKELLEKVLPIDEVKNNAQCYFIQNDLLMRKWTPHGVHCVGEPIYQVVVPSKFHSMVLQVSHDESGHQGVKKTYDRVLRYFFWPQLKRDISAYIQSCHTCQLTSKPNQSLRPAPLCPVPAIGQPFEHLIIDCVGPLPQSKSGANYLLTVMCQSTRYPAAYPLRSITARSVVRALSQFLSIFGIPKIIQSDQGSNFSSHLFTQVLRQLHIKHNQASAYHAQSQGALEWFHQTLKSMLRSYCVQMNRDWEEGLPWLLLAAREVIQESTGFSPNELVFGHTVRGPLALLQDNLKEMQPPQNLVDYVKDLDIDCIRHKSWLKENWQWRRNRSFLPGEQVLALLQIVSSPFHAKFAGPYSVVKKLSQQNYLIATPDRKSATQLCHVNLLKPYYPRTPQSAQQETHLSSECLHPVGLSVSMVPPHVVVEGEDGMSGPDEAVLQGRLKNSESLQNLDGLLSHLEGSMRMQLAELIKSYPCLFGDTPTCTHLIEHDIDVGDAKPIRRRFYRVHPEKSKYLDSEGKYMLDNGIAVLSSSSWASPCLLVPKSDNTPRFCSDFRKVSNVTKSDSFPLLRMDDCID
ncbi:hypothetical protein LDENG_00068500 [Lucifuga dentata]|nr:hypothetical protein LDENG_00068500 [Lucifuga dentata]